jgi:hypothetical protein
MFEFSIPVSKEKDIINSDVINYDTFLKEKYSMLQVFQ